ncbi:phytoene desaturase [Candidatus Saccharibacteria bacterium]|nr:phytoene desaturase [Candidatus Saccharibacteria bacterium]MBP7834954.1 phytoene desaturase [Candidatus Saccharibacteria bacterium]
MKIIIIGGGFSGLATASLLAKEGHTVTLLEKNGTLGGRAIFFQDKGFTFDMGPSWYMMPDLFDRYFALFNKKPSDYYTIKKLNPSYQVYDDTRQLTISPSLKTNYKNFEQIETGAGHKLEQYIKNGQAKYIFAKKYFLFNNYQYILRTPVSALFQLLSFKPFRNYDSFVNMYFKDSILRKTLKFMTVFLGGSPKSISSLYSLLGYTDMGLGIWYPMGGFRAVVTGIEKLAKENGVKIIKNQPVNKIVVKSGRVSGVESKNKFYEADIVVSSADYQFTDQNLVPKEYRSYSEKYWKKLKTSPSCLMFYVGLNKKIKNLQHHTMFFDAPWDDNFKSIENGTVPESPLFYLSSPSVTDDSVAPKDSENLFILIPVSNYAKISTKQKTQLFNNVISRIEDKLGTSISQNIVTMHSKDVDFFKTTFNAFRGNSFGASHTIRQSSLLRPRQKSKTINGLYFAGQYTNPGTGVPLVISSAELVRDYIKQDYPDAK